MLIIIIMIYIFLSIIMRLKFSDRFADEQKWKI